MRHTCASVVVLALAVSFGACGGANKGASLSTTVSSTTTGSTPTTASVHGPSPEAKSIAQFGHVASPADRQAITALVKRYYAAAAADDGATACSLIYSPLSESVAEDYGQAPAPASLAGTTCEMVMSKLFRQVPGQPSAVLATTEVTGVRVKGRKGYALLRSKTMPEGDISVERELGTWKVGILIGSALPGTPSPAPASTGPSKTSPPHYDAPGTPKVTDANDGEDDPGSNDDEPVIDFGKAASPGDTRAIATLVKRFYAATSAANGSAICSLIYNVVAESIVEDYENSPEAKGRTCAEIMGKVFAKQHHQIARDRSKLRVTRVRVEGDKGIVIVYLGKHPEPYFLVHRQGAEWKMQRMFITTLP
jgi:hypothetical protein